MTTVVAIIVCYVLLYVLVGLSCGSICLFFPHLSKVMCERCTAAQEVKRSIFWMLAWPLGICGAFILTIEFLNRL